MKYPTTLTGQTIDLVPLNKMHIGELENLAKDKRIWEFYPFDGTNSEKFIDAYTTLRLIELYEAKKNA